MDMESFESQKKQLRIQKYLDTRGRGLSRKFHVVVVQNNSEKMYSNVFVARAKLSLFFLAN